MPQKIDFLIVGQGLAGSCLALELINQQASVMVVDQINPNSASRVAAGLFNPVTGKTMQPTWRAAALFPFMVDWYRQVEFQLKGNFLHLLPILRPFVSHEEREQWAHKKADFVVGPVAVDPSLVQAPWGALQLTHCGFVNTAAYVNLTRQHLEHLGCLQNQPFDYSLLNVDGLTYRGQAFSTIIFCEGAQATENPYFNWLPLKKLKGETMQIKINLPSNVIFNRGVYAVPHLEQDVFTVGSTYVHDETSGNTEAGLQTLHDMARALFAKPYITLQNHWGHRPTSPDRRPMVGRHPKHQNLFIFNGLGTKGVSLAPFFAVQLAQHLLNKTDLDKAVNIERFFSLYFQSE
jgi:glycine oxidase